MPAHHARALSASACAGLTVLVQPGHLEVQNAPENAWHGTCIALHSADRVLTKGERHGPQTIHPGGRRGGAWRLVDLDRIRPGEDADQGRHPSLAVRNDGDLR